MPQSMTGFARASHVFDWGTLVCELKSVNHRYLDIQFRMPDKLRELEFPIRERLKKSFSRGKIECSLQLQFTSESGSDAILNIDQARRYLRLCGQIDSLISEQDQLTSAPISPAHVLQTTGILIGEESLPDGFDNALLEVCDQAVALLQEERRREGGEMAELVLQRLVGINRQVDTVRQLLPELRAMQRQKLTDRLQEIAIEVNEDRLEQELVHLAQKLDVDEELDRLQAHVDEVGRVMKTEQPIGRRLDFLMQELNREANTLGSKSQALSSTNSAVEMKVLIEQMREQIQNIE